VSGRPDASDPDQDRDDEAMARPQTPLAAWDALRQGNDRFVSGHREHPHQDVDRREKLVGGQRPFALIFGCSDSRVSAEIIFDRGLGDLFVVRTAGHVSDSGVLGSIEFGVEVLQIPLVVVIGHDRCGAVLATLQAHSSGAMPGGFVRDVVERVTPSVLSARQAGLGELDDVIQEHTRRTARLIVERSSAIAARVADGRCAVVGLNYTLAEGKVGLLESIGDLDGAA
jgi:carbonic anhydrase